jgi:hypothetical protein
MSQFAEVRLPSVEMPRAESGSAHWNAVYRAMRRAE